MDNSELKIRKGASFTCHGDGLCCTNVHSLGPLFDSEVQLLEVIDPAAVVRSGEESMLAFRDNGACVFCSETRCEIHAALGGHMKPEACQQFPFVLLQTSNGVRVSTEHRCPCRTLGERRSLDVAAVLDSLGDEDTNTIREGVRFVSKTTIDVSDWESVEAPILAALEAGTSPEEVLAAEPFEGSSPEALSELLKEFTGAGGSDRFAHALRCFGEAIKQMAKEVPAELPRCGWDDAFDRAEARTDIPGDPEAMLRDWVADELWGLAWVFRGSFAQAKTEIATRLAVARWIAARRVESGDRADRATAEAIAVAEIISESDDWQSWVETLPFPEAPALVRPCVDTKETNAD